MLTSEQQLTLASDMEKWYAAVADYACKTSKGIKTKNNINCLEAQLQIITSLYNNMTTQDLYSFQYPIYQSCSNFAVTYTTFSFGIVGTVGGMSIILDGQGYVFGDSDGTEVSVKNGIRNIIAYYSLPLEYVDLGAGLGFTLKGSYTLIQYRVLLNVANPNGSESEIVYETFCNTQAQNGALDNAEINCLLAKLAEGVSHGTGQNVTPNYLMWGTDMVNDILDYGTSSNQHLKWRF